MKMLTKVLVFCGLFLVLQANNSQAEESLFVPTSAWLVGPATLLQQADADFSMPCVMTNQFNNGFTVRFSGGGEKIVAMAIDFRQDAFTTGNRYDVDMRVAPDFEQSFSATAHNKATLLINLQKQDGLYGALKGEKILSLEIAGRKLEFALLGVRDGLARMEQCYSPGGKSGESTVYVREASKRADKAAPVYVSKVKPEAADALEEKVAAAPEPQKRVYVPVTTAETLKQAEETAPVAQKASAGDTFIRKMGEAPANNNAAKAVSASAEKVAGGMGNQLAAVDAMLQKAAGQLGKIEPAAGMEPKTMAVQPQTQIQVQPQQAPAQQRVAAQPIGQPLANSWLSPLVQQRDGMNQRDILVTPAAIQPQQAPAPGAYHGGRERRWRAVKGTSLHEVLDVWTRTENVRLMWKSPDEFSVADSLSMQGTFEQAVQSMLEQYEGARNRPYGRIYLDPVLNQRVLLIEGAGGL